MILILISWIYIFITSLNFGILFTKILYIKKSNPIILNILGLFFLTLITSFTAFFTRINIEYYTIILVANLWLMQKYKLIIKSHIRSLKLTFLNYTSSNKIFFLLLFIIVLAQSSTKPYLLDNESYYVQTIKWINEYGYVKGLANLHIFLGQNSGWHTLQAAFNFSFLTNRLNDLNGLLFILFGFLAFEKLNITSGNGTNEDFNFSLTLIFSLFLMQFINAPSPDLITYLMAPYILYRFIKSYNTIDVNEFKALLSLVLFLCFVKVTMIIFIIPIAVLFFKNYKVLNGTLLSSFALCSITIILFLAKNSIISWYLFYPLASVNILEVDWKLPFPIMEIFGNQASGMNNIDVSNLSSFEKFKYWINLPKLHGLFNKIYVLLLVLFPLVLFFRKEKKPLLIIYILAIIQFIILWINSPQYRFFFVFIIFFSIQLLQLIFKTRRISTILVYVSIVSCAIPVFIPIHLNLFTNNNHTMTLSTFHISNCIIPETNTKTITKFSKTRIDDFNFYSPGPEVFFWSTGDGDLPCVNKVQVEFIKNNYHYRPTQRTNNLKDGFRSIYSPPL